MTSTDIIITQRSKMSTAYNDFIFKFGDEPVNQSSDRSTVTLSDTSVSKVNDPDENSNGDEDNVLPQGVSPFLLKTYRMISDCDENLAGWSNDGEIFFVKDTAKFAAEVIPQYFDHRNFSSFTRQLNFYGFQKIQDRPIRKSDIVKSTAKHVKFCHDDFKRDQPELLRNIQRSTRREGCVVNAQQQQRQINELKVQVASYTNMVVQLTARIDTLGKKFSHLTEKLSQNQGDPRSNLGSGMIDIKRRFNTGSLKPPSLRSDGTSPLGYDPIPIADMSVSNVRLPFQSKYSTPTLQPHRKMKSKLPPHVGPVSSFPPYGSSLEKPSSIDSNLLDSSFDKRLFTTLMQDEK